MPKGHSLPNFSTPDYERDEDELPQYSARQQWPAGEAEETETPAAPDENDDERPYERGDDDGDAHEKLYRAGKIDAYLSYLKMRPAEREPEPVTLRRSIPFSERPSRRSFEEDTQRETRLYGYQQRSIQRPSPRAPRLAPRRPRRKGLAKEIAVAAGLSLAVGGLTGLIVYDRTSGGTLASSVMAMVAGPRSDAPAAAPPQPVQQPQADLADAEPEQPAAVSKKSVAIAQLDVEDAAGMASSLIPLSLRADPGIPGQDLAFRLSGLPENAYLTAGTRISSDAWMLRQGEEQNVKLVVPPSGAGQFAIEVEAIESRTGDLAAPMKEITVDVRPALTAKIEPAAAPASITRNFNLPAVQPPVAVEPAEPAKPLADSAMPIPAPIEKTSLVQPEVDAAQGLIHNGDKLMDLGDLTAARQFYAKALDEGVSEAALKLGQTYDPSVFAEKNVQGLKPDPSMAMKYYLQAQASGVADAAQSITSLDAWMQK
jgi:hypothetical protein